MSATVNQITQQSFTVEVLQAETPVIVDFWAPWCGPCRMLDPELEKAAEQLGGHATVAKVNVDEHPMLASQYGVMSIPTLVIFHQGKEIGRHSGFVSADTLTSTLHAYLGTGVR